MIIYILLFASLITPHFMIPDDDYDVRASVEIYYSIEEVNKRITTQCPYIVYSYNIETKELQKLEIEFYREIKIKENKEESKENINECIWRIDISTRAIENDTFILQ